MRIHDSPLGEAVAVRSYIGLDAEQLDELEELVSELLEEPRDKGNGRHGNLPCARRSSLPADTSAITSPRKSGAEIFDADQSTISLYIT
jgi:hypothetical protein